MKKILIILTILTATSANADTAEELCMGEKYQAPLVGGFIGGLGCIIAPPVGCVAIPVLAGLGYAGDTINNPYKGCVEARRKDLETFNK